MKGVLGLQCCDGQELECVVLGARFFGVILEPAKTQPLRSSNPFLGHTHDFQPTFGSQSEVIYGPKPGSRQKVIDKCESALCAERLTSGEASALRGDVQWLDSGLYGRCMRGAAGALIARQ